MSVYLVCEGSFSVNIVRSTKENVRDYVLTASFSSGKTDIEPVPERLKFMSDGTPSSPCHGLLSLPRRRS